MRKVLSVILSASLIWASAGPNLLWANTQGLGGGKKAGPVLISRYPALVLSDFSRSFLALNPRDQVRFLPAFLGFIRKNPQVLKHPDWQGPMEEVRDLLDRMSQESSSWGPEQHTQAAQEITDTLQRAGSIQSSSVLGPSSNAKRLHPGIKAGSFSKPSPERASVVPSLEPGPQGSASPVQKRAKLWLAATSFSGAALAAGFLLGMGHYWSVQGIPLALAVGLPSLGGLFMAQAGNLPEAVIPKWMRERMLKHRQREAEKEGGKLLSEAEVSRLLPELAGLAEKAGLPQPLVYQMSGPFRQRAEARPVPGSRQGLVLISSDLPADSHREDILAHELQHLKDSPFHMLGWRAASGLAIWLGLGASVAGSVLDLLGLPAFSLSPDFRWLEALVLGFFGFRLFLSPLHAFLQELRADLGAAVMTGGLGIVDAVKTTSSTGLRLKALKWMLGLPLSSQEKADNSWKQEKGLYFPASSQPDDKDPAYYQAEPEWAKTLSADPQSFKTQEDLKRYQEDLKRLRPLARWMAHFHAKLREDSVQRPPNLLTIQDVLNWADYIKKWQAAKGWSLGSKVEKYKDPATGMEKERDLSAVLRGIEAVFKESLPAETYEGRDLRREVEAGVQEYLPVFKNLDVPERLPAVLPDKDEDPGEIQTPSSREPSLEEPGLFEAKEVENMEAPDIILTPTVKKRWEDLMTLYSTDHKKKFFPLIVGPTGEGKSSLIKYMFSRPDLRKMLGRSVPVISIPVKEAMTRRELLGGLSTQGTELGFLALAVQEGWVLVLEELNQASGEFLKSLNTVLHQIRKQGYCEFELGGKTVRIKAHPHFWLVGTENPEEGNYSYTRNPHSPDFMKRFVVRYYDRIPPAEQAEIMRGLALKWYGEDWVRRHKLSLDFFEKLVTQFHEPVRKMTDAGKFGGDLQEPYEFNRRTLHRFLKRYLHDLLVYEKKSRAPDEKTRHLLLARELMEAYGAELRSAAEKESLWDKINVVFELKKTWGIEKKDVEIEIEGFYRKDGRLIVQEKLVPLEIPIRSQAGARVPGPEHRLTAVPSLLESVYRALRNRQFHEHQFSSGPTGTAKTAEQVFIAHLLGEPLFVINMDEQTASRELHGGFVNDPAAGGFRFVPGILARAMMYDPQGILKPGKDGKKALSPAEVRKSPHVGATILIDEANSSPIVETINPALDDGVANLSDGRHSAVAGAGFHAVLAMNPVGEGYVGYPMTGALRSRAQTVFHPGETSEEELTEIILDQLTGVTRHQVLPGRENDR